MKTTNNSMDIQPEKKDSTKLHSMKELADFLECSVPTAQKIKNSGKIPFHQIGRKVMFDKEEILNATRMDATV
ncbi:MAG TPA: helix-turn-helix domain-containing protein [Paludibacter sp.]|nr:helix-turn-helix domain-containing protein [Paludibacter sp.]